MDKSFTLMKIAAVAIIIAVIVTAAFVIIDGGKVRFNKATRQMNSATSEFDNPALQAYEGATITGAEVITAINKYASKDFIVRVKTTSNSTSYPYNRKYDSIKERSINDEINTSASFEGNLQRNKNGEITGLEFSQSNSSTSDYSELMSYDNVTLRGSEVIQLINKYASRDFKVSVTYSDYHTNTFRVKYDDVIESDTSQVINDDDSYLCTVAKINRYIDWGVVGLAFEDTRLNPRIFSSPSYLDGRTLSGSDIIEAVINNPPYFSSIWIYSEDMYYVSRISLQKYDQNLWDIIGDIINPRSTYACFVVGPSCYGNIEFIETSSSLIRYDGVIMTGEEVIDLINRRSPYHLYSTWYTEENSPNGFRHYQYTQTEASSSNSRIDPNAIFKVEMARVDTSMPTEDQIEGFNFYQIN